MPFVAVTLIRFLRLPTWGRALALCASVTAQALVSWYLAAVTAVLVLVLFLLHVGRTRWTLRHTALAATATALCAAIVLPTAIPYRNSMDATLLGDRTAEALAPRDRVSLSDYLEPPRATFAGQLRQAGPWIWGEQTLYVGYTPLVLALAGFVLRRPRRAAEDSVQVPAMSGRWTTTGICLVVTGFALAQGFISAEQTRLPLFYLSELPGLDFLKALRATQRFSLLLYFGVMILSGAAIAGLAARCRRPIVAWTAVALACVMFLAEVYPYRLPFQPQPYEVSRLDRAIKRFWPEEQPAPVVLHLPIHYFLRDYATPEAVYMLDSTHHWARIVNGFSGAEPRGFRSAMEALNTLPDNRAVETLAELGVDLVAIHGTAPAPMRRSLVDFFEAAPWAQVHRVGDEQLVRIDRNAIPAP